MDMWQIIAATVPVVFAFFLYNSMSYKRRNSPIELMLFLGVPMAISIWFVSSGMYTNLFSTQGSIAPDYVPSIPATQIVSEQEYIPQNSTPINNTVIPMDVNYNLDIDDLTDTDFLKT